MPFELLITMYSIASKRAKNGYFSFSYSQRKFSRNTEFYYGRRQRKIGENEGPSAYAG